MKTIYIAGPMSGYPGFNFPAFFAAEEEFKGKGWNVKNPAAKDHDANGPEVFSKNETGDVHKAAEQGWDFRAAFKWDTDAVIDGDAIYMLTGWEYSPGATAEHAIAKFVKKNYPEFEIIYQ